jgi:hypothetical protein
MKITEEVRRMAQATEVEAGLAAKAAEFRAGGQRIYVEDEPGETT